MMRNGIPDCRPAGAPMHPEDYDALLAWVRAKEPDTIGMNARAGLVLAQAVDLATGQVSSG